jgi:CRP/FNR family transcriptional regulator
MAIAPIREPDELLVGHPCHGCAVRDKAVCHVLDGDDLASYKQLGWTLRARAGQTVFHEGDPADRVFTLTRGALKLYRLLPDGRRQVVGFMLPGDFLGIAVEGEHAFSVEALEESSLCWLPSSRFSDFISVHWDMERALYRRTAHELAAARQQMVLLGRKTAEERLASFFLSLLERSESASGGRERIVRLPMTRSDIADYLGLTKETVSRVLALLKGKRVVRLEAIDRIEILDRERLTAIAEAMADS